MIRIRITETEKGNNGFKPVDSERTTIVEFEGPVKAISWEKYEGIRAEFYNLEKKDAES